ncbi:MAG: transposase [Flavobacteriales bacterium Tduv]
MTKTRWVVEPTFGKIKRWFRPGKDRDKGLARVHAQYLMEDMVHNLYRYSGIIIRSS